VPCRWARRTWSLRPGSNRLPARYEGAALPSELHRHELPDKDSNLDYVDQNHVSCQLNDPALVRAAGVEPARAMLTKV
jgi:hypothetical protein